MVTASNLIVVWDAETSVAVTWTWFEFAWTCVFHLRWVQKRHGILGGRSLVWLGPSHDVVA